MYLVICTVMVIITVLILKDTHVTVYYNILLDDRAGLEESYEILKYVVDEIKLNQQGNQ